jgi:hypothetical protein
MNNDYMVEVEVVTYRVNSWGKIAKNPKRGGWIARIESQGQFEVLVTPPGRRFFSTEEEAHEAGEERLNNLFGYYEEIG